MKKITVIGTGYVGLVTGACYSEAGHQVICCDVDLHKVDLLNSGKLPFYEPGLEELVTRNRLNRNLIFTNDVAHAIQQADIIYIAVGTPMLVTGEADLQYVVAVAKTIGENLNGYKVIVNKSTVPVGTGRLVQQVIRQNRSDSSIEYDVVSNPEFLREGSAVKDCMNMERAVLGATSEKAAEIIKELHTAFTSNIIITDIESAEMIKYAANAFLATKISFINDIANLCERLGANISDVARGVGADSRIGEKFLQAGIGFGGSCFPKDTQALIQIASGVEYDFKLLKSVLETNEKQPNVVINKLKERFADLRGKRIAVLGLSYKPNTDDMRCAPSLIIIPELIKLGASVNAFDPVSIPAAQRQINNDVNYYPNMYDAVTDCDACVILTEWKHIVDMDLSKVFNLMKSPVMVDGRNCLSMTEMEKYTFDYYSIGRPTLLRSGESLY